MDILAAMQAMQLAMSLIQQGTDAYARVKAALDSNDDAALKLELTQLQALNDALVKT